MDLKDIKLRFIFEKKIVKALNRSLIWKIDGLSFSIYKDSPTFVNVTGLKSLDDIEHYKLETEKLFTQKVVKVGIDNTFFSKKDCKNIDMRSLYNYLKDDKNYFCDYNIELFAGMYLQPKDKFYPTILLFRTVSCTLIYEE